MIKTLRVAIVAMLALAAGLAATQTSAQMMHFTLYVVVETEDGGAIPAGQVCVSGEVDWICQDIPAGTPSGREFEFDDLGDGYHSVQVTADPYLPAGADIQLSDENDTITMTLDVDPSVVTPTPAPNLPDTGAGPTTDGGSSSFLLITGLLGAAGVFAAASSTYRRKER